MKLKAEITSITPEMATRLLESNLNNRPLNTPVVNLYAKDMKMGRWHEGTGEAIKLASDGTIVDGQHRLSAIVKAGVPVLMMIVKDVPKEAFAFIDTGKRRSSADTLHINGSVNATIVSGIISSYLKKKEGRTSVVQTLGHAGMTNADVLDAYRSRPDYWQEVCTKTLRWYKQMQKMLTPSFIGSTYALLSEIDEPSALFFFERLSTGTNLSDNSPIKILRDRLIQEFGSKRKLPEREKAALLIKAWNHHRHGKTVSIIKWDKEREPYPKAV